MDEPLRSGNRPKPQHWKSDESTEVEETSAEEDEDWNDDSDAIGPSTPKVALRFLEEVCAH